LKISFRDTLLNQLICSDSSAGAGNGSGSLVEEDNVDGLIPPYYSPENVTHCRAFVDGKRKLRLVLSSAGSLTNSSPLYFESMRFVLQMTISRRRMIMFAEEKGQKGNEPN